VEQRDWLEGLLPEGLDGRLLLEQLLDLELEQLVYLALISFLMLNLGGGVAGAGRSQLQIELILRSLSQSLVNRQANPSP